MPPIPTTRTRRPARRMRVTYPSLADALGYYASAAAEHRRRATECLGQLSEHDGGKPAGVPRYRLRERLIEALATARTLERVVRELRDSGFAARPGDGVPG